MQQNAGSVMWNDLLKVLRVKNDAKLRNTSEIIYATQVEDYQFGFIPGSMATTSTTTSTP